MPEAGTAEVSRHPVIGGGPAECWEKPGRLATREPQLHRILNLSMPVSVILCDREMTVAGLLGMSPGTIIEFGAPFDAELKLCVGGRVIALGQAVKVGERYGLRISRIESVLDRIDAMRSPVPSD